MALVTPNQEEVLLPILAKSPLVRREDIQRSQWQSLHHLKRAPRVLCQKVFRNRFQLHTVQPMPTSLLALNATRAELQNQLNHVRNQDPHLSGPVERDRCTYAPSHVLA